MPRSSHGFSTPRRTLGIALRREIGTHRPGERRARTCAERRQRSAARAAFAGSCASRSRDRTKTRQALHSRERGCRTTHRSRYNTEPSHAGARDSVRPSTPGRYADPTLGANGLHHVTFPEPRGAAATSRPRPRRSTAAAPSLIVRSLSLTSTHSAARPPSPPPASGTQRRFLVGRSRGHDPHAQPRLGLPLVSSPNPLAPR
jgi:hypothetical protein